MSSVLWLAEVLANYMRRPDPPYTPGLLFRKSGVPKATIVNWLEGRVRRPRRWEDLVRVAAAMRLTAIETDHLLAAAGHPSLALLWGETSDPKERSLLAHWIDAAAPQQAASPARLRSLPVPPTSLVGREREITTVAALLKRSDLRLLTLVGPGGAGKSRVALAVATRLMTGFGSGGAFIRLAAVQDPALVAVTIAQALGIVDIGAQELHERIAAVLHDRQQLLVLDAFEHLLEAAPLVNALLASAPQLKVLVTSRAVLGLAGEHVFSLPQMQCVDPRMLRQNGQAMVAAVGASEAVQLFVERARASRGEFELTAANALTVAEICYRLDGLPLAIELAAARSRVLTPQALLARITGASGQRPLDLLTGGPRDHPVYQQTLRGTIDWSYQLLTEDEQQLFERLGVFVGDGTIEAIEAICNATHDLRITVFDGLISLEEKSLLRQTRVQAGDPRFGMLATIRTYALERLSERAEYAQIQQHYASWVLGLVEEAEAHLHTVDELAWLDRLEAELENVRGVMAWALKQSDPTLSAQLASALGEFCWARGYVTLGRHWLTSVLARHEQIVAVVRAKALARCGMLAWIQGDYNEAIDHCQAALALYQNLDIASGCAWTLRHLAYVLWDQGNYEATQALLTESLACARADGNRSASARALHMLGWVAVHRGDETLAVACYEECLALSRAVGDRQFIAHSLNDLGLVWQRRGDYRQATALIESGMGLRRELTINVGIAWSCLNLGLVARDQHDYPRATRWFRESLRLRQDLGDRRGIAECLEALAAVASLENLPAHAAHYYGAAAQLRETIGAPLRSFEHAEYERYVARVRAALGAKQFMRDWTVGQHMRLAEVLGEHDVMVAE